MSKVVRMYEEDHETLRELSKEVGAPMPSVLAEVMFHADMESVERDLEQGKTECPECGCRFQP